MDHLVRAFLPHSYLSIHKTESSVRTISLWNWKCQKLAYLELPRFLFILTPSNVLLFNNFIGMTSSKFIRWTIETPLRVKIKRLQLRAEFKPHSWELDFKNCSNFAENLFENSSTHVSDDAKYILIM